MLKEQTLCFQSQGSWLNGIVHVPSDDCSGQGVVIVVGGPQTRVGSHRQFLLLARTLAANGHHVLRFDYHGNGDSEGDAGSFINCQQDIALALQVFKERYPKVRELNLWGLCDAASAILLYCKQANEPQVARLVLLNPWVTTTHLQAQTMLRHYYLRKLFDKALWRKLAHGKFNVFQSLKDLAVHAKSAISAPKQKEVAKEHKPTIDNYVALMLQGLTDFSGEVLFILSGNDLVAAEFELLMAKDAEWKEACGESKVTISRIAGATHTFSSEVWRREVEALTQSMLAP